MSHHFDLRETYEMIFLSNLKYTAILVPGLISKQTQKAD